jgi:hypothetical protein
MGDEEAGTTGEGEGAAEAGGKAREGERAERGLPPASLSLLVATLAVQAQVHLGVHENPGTGRVQKNLPAAKHAIDLLAVLESKTAGNLDAQEQALLNRALHDLRLAYVRAVRS